MKRIIENTELLENSYIDIHSIAFDIDMSLWSKTLKDCNKILKDNPILESVSISLFNNNSVGIQTGEFFNSSEDDEDKTNECDTIIDVESITMCKTGSVWYTGSCKYTGEELEVDLTQY